MAKVLIIDDDKALCYDMSQSVAEWGHEVRTAETATGGFTALDDWRPDVVLCDLNLPDGSGMDIMRYINSIGVEASDVTFLFISTEPAARAITDALNLGADDYLVKPIDYGVMKARINGLLRKQEKYAVEFDNLTGETAAINGVKFAAVFTIGFFILGITSLALIYWFKSVLGINLFDDVHFRDVLPF